MEFTTHAALRMQQRAIPPLIVQWLSEYGSEMHVHGAVRRYFDKDARKRLAKAVGHQIVNRLGDLLNIYTVDNEERLITAGHRTRRFRRR